MLSEKQTKRHTDRHADRQEKFDASRQTDRQTRELDADRQKNKQTNRQKDRQTDRQTDRRKKLDADLLKEFLHEGAAGVHVNRNVDIVPIFAVSLLSPFKRFKYSKKGRRVFKALRIICLGGNFYVLFFLS